MVRRRKWSRVDVIRHSLKVSSFCGIEVCLFKWLWMSGIFRLIITTNYRPEFSHSITESNVRIINPGEQHAISQKTVKLAIQEYQHCRPAVPGVRTIELVEWLTVLWDRKSNSLWWSYSRHYKSRVCCSLISFHRHFSFAVVLATDPQMAVAAFLSASGVGNFVRMLCWKVNTLRRTITTKIRRTELNQTPF